MELFACELLYFIPTKAQQCTVDIKTVESILFPKLKLQTLHANARDIYIRMAELHNLQTHSDNAHYYREEGKLYRYRRSWNKHLIKQSISCNLASNIKPGKATLYRQTTVERFSSHCCEENCFYSVSVVRPFSVIHSQQEESSLPPPKKEKIKGSQEAA